MPTRTSRSHALRSRGPLVALVSTVAVLAACSGEGATTTSPGGQQTSQSSQPSGSPQTSAAQQVTLVNPGKLTTCTHLPYPPFQFERGGEVVGFDVALVDLVAQKLGVEQQVVDTPFETIQTGVDLNAGKCDIAAAGMTITEERKRNIDFSVPYFDATQALLAKKGSGISSLESAQGKKVGSQSATTGEQFVREAGIDSVSFETSEAELNALKSGQVDVIVQDLPVVNDWLKDEDNADLEVVANLDTGEQYGFAVKKDGNPALLQTINDTLTQARQDGTYDTIYREWIGEQPAS